tara:strand:- start:1744 stop:2346 length:603 start_codon:yes stop_codon:yes gene_type:complete
MSKENSKNQILKAAMKIFVVNGYTNTKMDDIAEEAGFSKGAVYHHFSSKNELFFSLIDYWEASFLPKFYSKNYSDVSLVNVLKELASEVASNFKNKKYLFLAELEIWALSNRDSKVRERTKKLYNKMLSHLEKIFSNAMYDGDYKNIDPGMAAMAVMTSMQGVIWFSIFDHKSFTAEEYVNEVINFIINGLKKTSTEMTN